MRGPQVEAATGLPARVTVYEVGPRDGLQNEEGHVPTAVKAGVRPAAGRGRTADRRDHLVRAIGVGTPAGRRRGASRGPGTGRARAQPAGPGSQREGAGPGAGGRRPGDRRLRERHGDLRAQQPRPERGRVARDVPAGRGRAREAGLWVRGYVSMCFGDPWEGDVPVGQVVDVAVRMNDLGLDQLCLGDTIGVGTTGHVHRLVDALDARGSGSSTWVCTSTTPTARR